MTTNDPIPTQAPQTPCAAAFEGIKLAREDVAHAHELMRKAGESIKAREGEYRKCINKRRAEIDAEAREFEMLAEQAEEPFAFYESGGTRAGVKVSGLRRFFGFSGTLSVGGGLTMLVIWIMGMFDPRAPQRVEVPVDRVVEKRVEVPVEIAKPVFVTFDVSSTECFKRLRAFMADSGGQLFGPQESSLRAALEMDNMILKYRVDPDGKMTLVETIRKSSQSATVER